MGDGLYLVAVMEWSRFSRGNIRDGGVFFEQASGMVANKHCIAPRRIYGIFTVKR
jgi:hypothetical protein